MKFGSPLGTEYCPRHGLVILWILKGKDIGITRSLFPFGLPFHIQMYYKRVQEMNPLPSIHNPFQERDRGVVTTGQRFNSFPSTAQQISREAGLMIWDYLKRKHTLESPLSTAHTLTFICIPPFGSRLPPPFVTMSAGCGLGLRRLTSVGSRHIKVSGVKIR